MLDFFSKNTIFRGVKLENVKKNLKKNLPYFFRQKGNDAFSKKDWLLAAEKYMEAIMRLVVNKKNVAIYIPNKIVGFL